MNILAKDIRDMLKNNCFHTYVEGGTIGPATRVYSVRRLSSGIIHVRVMSDSDHGNGYGKTLVWRALQPDHRVFQK